MIPVPEEELPIAEEEPATNTLGDTDSAESPSAQRENLATKPSDEWSPFVVLLALAALIGVPIGFSFLAEYNLWIAAVGTLGCVCFVFLIVIPSVILGMLFRRPSEDELQAQDPDEPGTWHFAGPGGFILYLVVLAVLIAISALIGHIAEEAPWIGVGKLDEKIWEKVLVRVLAPLAFVVAPIVTFVVGRIYYRPPE